MYCSECQLILVYNRTLCLIQGKHHGHRKPEVPAKKRLFLEYATVQLPAGLVGLSKLSHCSYGVCMTMLLKYCYVLTEFECCSA